MKEIKPIWVCTECNTVMTFDDGIVKYDPHAPKCPAGADPKPFYSHTDNFELYQKFMISLEAIREISKLTQPYYKDFEQTLSTLHKCETIVCQALIDIEKDEK